MHIHFYFFPQQPIPHNDPNILRIYTPDSLCPFLTSTSVINSRIVKIESSNSSKRVKHENVGVDNLMFMDMGSRGILVVVGTYLKGCPLSSALGTLQIR